MISTLKTKKGHNLVNHVLGEITVLFLYTLSDDALYLYL